MADLHEGLLEIGGSVEGNSRRLAEEYRSLGRTGLTSVFAEIRNLMAERAAHTLPEVNDSHTMKQEPQSFAVDAHSQRRF